MRLLNSLTLTVLITTWGNCCAGQEAEQELSISAANEPDSQLVTTLLEEWRQERDRLASGIAVVKSTALDFHPRTKQRVEGKAEFATAFDWMHGHFRFDRRYGQSGGQLIRTPFGTVNRKLPDGIPKVDRLDAKINDYVSAFDIRNLGIATEGELTGLNPTLDDVVDWFCKERRLEDVTRVTDDRYRVRWEQKTEEVSSRFTVWLNRARGATPEELQIHVLHPHESEWRLASQVITEWNEVNSVYVPVRCEELRLIPEYGTARRQLAIEWKAINQPVDAQRFLAGDLTNFLSEIAD